MKPTVSESDFLLILQACEDNCEVLHDLNDKHFLHTFSNRLVPADESHSLNLKVVNHFLRERNEQSQQHPTFEEVMAAYGHFCIALEAAICFERLKTCSMQEPKSPA